MVYTEEVFRHDYRSIARSYGRIRGALRRIARNVSQMGTKDSKCKERVDKILSDLKLIDDELSFDSKNMDGIIDEVTPKLEKEESADEQKRHNSH